MLNYETLKTKDPQNLRQIIRDGQYDAHTAGLAKGYLQANIVILPRIYALDFMRFCQRNPKPCPLVAVSDTGDPYLTTAGHDIDIRTDIPIYNIYRDGVMDEERGDISPFWNDEMITFALGCSFTFEHALLKAGIDVWHISNNKTVPMYKTSLKTVPAGPFSGATVVSMRMIPENRVDEVRSICRQFPLAHGSPLHVGDPAEIGISDLAHPDWGDAVPSLPGHLPVFWACGVTPQAAIQNAKLPLCITHKPGHMLITNIPDDAEVPIIKA
ncbi:putative hydro-lyase [Cohaesibacter celericrescens]|uniref:putative hydro-lyase n=1 Tax=Cohaesibacter celericrescens TaxID=2067669 RepID=UPI003561B558